MADSRYKNGKIYRLVCDDGHYYIGSTINQLKYRLSNHKQLSKDSTTKVYQYINSVGWDTVNIKLIEDWPCGSKEALLEREAFYINELKDDTLCLNVNRCAVSKEERLENMKVYYETHKEEIVEQHKEYISIKKQKVEEYQADYRKKNAEKRRAYSKQYAEEHTEETKAARKAYYEEHKSEILEKTKVYVEKNKEKIQERKRDWSLKKKDENKEVLQEEQVERKQQKNAKTEASKVKREQIRPCECGGSYQPYRKPRHDISKKHIAFLQSSSSS
jgi:hypothetical protein